MMVTVPMMVAVTVMTNEMVTVMALQKVVNLLACKIHQLTSLAPIGGPTGAHRWTH